MVITHNVMKTLAISLLTMALAACSDRSINDIRMQRFDQPELTPVTVKPSAQAVNLNAAPGGSGLSSASLNALNEMLNKQGRLAKQSLTITPYTPRGEQIAARLSIALKNAGADPQKVNVQRRLAMVSGQGDLQVTSRALAIQTSRCAINDPNMLMVKPFESVGYLGCANQNNLAMMVAEPRDLIQARSLAEADGVAAVNSIERYQGDDVKELLNIDFSED
ncbi:CpaD family pilus assembly lipoprotein [Klebsiella sp. 2680]|uniref:CpaD family pilus assembly lipoprotein n=1 Tax=Klebsiella sp. 2680 TaxID=2018037 RepID=UPI001156C999|nr:CpaD family pilus assembly lipoprotein [Klebsiella sp. 2680]